MRRVLVTGLALFSPFGMGFEHSWKKLLTGRSAAKRITEFEVEDLACKIAHVVPRGDGSNATLNPEAVLEPKELRKIGDFILYGIAAADEALKGIRLGTQDPRRTMPPRRAHRFRHWRYRRHRRERDDPQGAWSAPHQPLLHPGPVSSISSPARFRSGTGWKGPNHAVVTACSTGAHAIGDAARLIMWGDADVMVAGGAEAPVTRLSIAGFAACRALSTDRNDTPQTASRPDHRDLVDGFVDWRGAPVLQHFGSPERFLAATREELEAVPGVPGKVAREIHEKLNRTG